MHKLPRELLEGQMYLAKRYVEWFRSLQGGDALPLVEAILGNTVTKR